MFKKYEDWFETYLVADNQSNDDQEESIECSESARVPEPSSSKKKIYVTSSSPVNNKKRNRSQMEES